MSEQTNLQIYEMFTSLFVTISKGEQFIESIKQVLTTLDLFHPLVLFKYLAKGNPILQRKHILSFLQQNDYSATEQDMKIIFSLEGIKDKMNYSTFLKMIYPCSLSANREIVNTHLKNYSYTEKLQINEEILACFYLLITQQIDFINRVEVQKQDSFVHCPKGKVQKALRNIKKLSEKPKAHCEYNPDVITGLQLIYFIKNFTNIDESSLLYLLRRLGTGHLGSIQISKLEAFIKPWKKAQSITVQNQQNEGQQVQGSLPMRFNEQNYRKQLNAQISRSISQKKGQNVSKRKIRKQGSIKIKQGQFCSKKQSDIKSILFNSYAQTPSKQKPKQSNKKQKQPKPNPNNVRLFIKFISIFLKNISQIQRLKIQLNRNNQINYLKIFKSIDRRQRGVITGQELQQCYQSWGGVNVSINFDVLVNSLSQTSQGWISYSQFCQIFKPSIQRAQRTNLGGQNALSTAPQQQSRILSQILYLTLLNEHQLLQIRREFNKQELFHLFTLINKEQTGFINYQELKMFLAEINFTNLSMYELMLLLKRLDRCKNGVVSQNQFVDYFLVQM